MKLTIRRFKNIHDGTLGKFELCVGQTDERVLLSGYTLEPAGDDCVTPGRDLRIPQGKYDVAWEYSPRFGRVLPTLFNENVIKARRILIHAGNYPKHTLGCILLGQKYDDKGVYEGKKTLEAFLKITKDKPLTVEIINLQGV
ncbi:hypothetical protein CCAL9344_01290 [Campylobacter sp. RM9344]|uniref:DUF5675 domain-containing protein n=1 Tax=Campylobacter californiensis TaxID=1032243 RepID=A0AAW3ZTS8_9BACT|nr:MULTISPECIES: DUF5675 family protein [unclassified Campylobacter]MBE2984650.1 hypothetical protein [Campylobacter sp. RM6883]MBE2994566.1 hypothetical protein [Campylobacter sp. RM6913]MBE3028833.1 hypothetical protein [Campylobacter sp. RM9344]MBE3607191.1 hypothetical protein [Campylobacter sp. RM9337]MBE3609509.1 hypothetical protein [Campylobacter sp. RM12916]